MIYALAAAAVLLLFFFSNEGSEIPENKPTSVPDAVWRWKDDVKRIAARINYPLDPSWGLALVAQESTGRTETPGTPEEGLRQLLPIAVEDVNENTAYSFDYPPKTPRRNIMAGMLYDRLNYERSEAPTHATKRTEAIRAANEGPPPITNPASNEHARYVADWHERITDQG